MKRFILLILILIVLPNSYALVKLTSDICYQNGNCTLNNLNVKNFTKTNVTTTSLLLINGSLCLNGICYGNLTTFQNLSINGCVTFPNGYYICGGNNKLGNLTVKNLYAVPDNKTVCSTNSLNTCFVIFGANNENCGLFNFWNNSCSWHIDPYACYGTNQYQCYNQINENDCVQNTNNNCYWDADLNTCNPILCENLQPTDCDLNQINGWGCTYQAQNEYCSNTQNLICEQQTNEACQYLDLNFGGVCSINQTYVNGSIHGYSANITDTLYSKNIYANNVCNKDNPQLCLSNNSFMVRNGSNGNNILFPTKVKIQNPQVLSYVIGDSPFQVRGDTGNILMAMTSGSVVSGQELTTLNIINWFPVGSSQGGYLTFVQGTTGVVVGSFLAGQTDTGTNAGFYSMRIKPASDNHYQDTAIFYANGVLIGNDYNSIPTYQPNASMIILNRLYTTNPNLIIKKHSGQTKDLLQIVDSNNRRFLNMDFKGNLNITHNLTFNKKINITSKGNIELMGNISGNTIIYKKNFNLRNMTSNVIICSQSGICNFTYIRIPNNLNITTTGNIISKKGNLSMAGVTATGLISGNGGIISGGNTATGGASAYYWTSRSRMYSPADGRIKFTDSGGINLASLELKNINFSGNITSTNKKINITSSTGSIKLAGNLVVGNNLSVRFPYFTVISNDTQRITSTTTAYPIYLNYTVDSYQATIQNKVNISFGQEGDYHLSLSIIGECGTNNKHIEMWVRKNDIDIPNSNTLLELNTANTENLFSVPFIIDAIPTDKIKLMWHSDSTNCILKSTPAQISPTRPTSPAVILTGFKISEEIVG